MTYQEVLENARTCIGPFCKACPVCNGKACSNKVPGPGAKGTGTVAIQNYDAWQKICINMDTICENKPVDTSFELFGQTFRYPIFAGPVGFTGDGTNPAVMEGATQAIKAAGGKGIPTIKPWDINTLKEKFALVKDSGAFAAAMDIDAAGLPFLKNQTPPAGSKSVEELKEVVQAAGVPFILKGIMTVKGALKAKEAGAAAIVVSNHGGRVLDQCPPTAEVLPEIAEAVGKDIKIFVDGGIRSGVDILKALALGADAVLIGRPFVTAVYGGAAEGVSALTEKLSGELADAMAMCGVHSLSEITREVVR